MPADEWTQAEHVDRYLARADDFPHRLEGEGVLLEQVPLDVRRVLDLGTGAGRLLALLREGRPRMRAIGVDFSPIMLSAARERFAGDDSTGCGRSASTTSTATGSGARWLSW